MGFTNGSFAKVWSIELPKDKKFANVNLSISRKRKDADGYETTFSGFVSFVGDAYKKIGKLKEKDRIKILATDVDSSYNKEKKESKYFFKVFDWEPANTSSTTQNTHPSDSDDDIPF